MKKKLLNFRLFFLCAIILVIAILFAVYILKDSLNLICAFLFCTILFLVSLALCLIFKKSIFKVLTILLSFVCITFVSTYSVAAKLDNLKNFDEKQVVVSGRISDTKISNNRYARLTLDNVTIKSKSEEKAINQKINVIINESGFDDRQVELGRYVVVDLKLDVYDISNMDSYTGGYIAKDIVAQGFCYHYNITFLDEFDKNLRDKIKEATNSHLQNLDMKYSEIGYAMLFGDTSFIEDDVIEVFRSTGIAHILAVSGLHISIIVAVLTFFLKKMKLSKLVQFILIGIFLGFYCYVCNFSVSVIRASLMCLLFLYAMLRGKCYDRLSALCLVAALMLMFSPFQIFSVSFVLSFTLNFAITLLSMYFYKGLSKVLTKKVAATLALNFAIQFIIFACSLYYFKNYPILGILANLITVPIITIMFVYFIFMTIGTAIFPFLSFTKYVYSFVMDYVFRLNYSISNLNFVVSVPSISGLIIVLMMLFIFAISKHLFVKTKPKVALSGTLMIAMLSLFIVSIAL